ncbi:hypothetical protein BTA51_08180 [Hahella sp. CCB-MM4]|uniref:HAD-IA family hydrolase n=1 Tax=Hahella sp. (strain CCB-MM4) TaxID=1926491 RepID=UPI000B9A96E7|nr:HAD-IA family hydrolase [Hahella sp. CCB-MM4]OZG73778.1 hypothetical protein BTA51_08180 [Hahella sp. CCB-MM4]
MVLEIMDKTRCSFSRERNNDIWYAMTPRPGVIFDFDGVIADSLPLLYQKYEELLAGYDKTATRAEFSSLNGAKVSEIAARLVAAHKLNVSAEDVAERFKEAIAKVPQQLTMTKGALDTLHTLRFLNIPIALATASSKDYFSPFLHRNGIEQYFSAIISGDDVKVAKPAPDIYQLAISRLQTEDNWVIEDARAGIISANLAGAKSLWLSNPWESGEAETLAQETLERLPSLAPRILGLEVTAIELVALSKQIRIRPIEQPYIPTLVIKDSEDLWQQSLQENPNLFDSTISVYHSHFWEEDVLVINVQPGRYRDFYLARKAGNPFPALGVNGVMRDTHPDSILIGKRSVTCTEYPGAWETVPAGGIPYDSPDWQAAIIQEAIEETTVQEENIKQVEAVGLFLDKHHGVYDVVCTLKTDDLSKLKAREEYQHLETVNIMSSQIPEQWVPLSNAVLKVFQWMNQYGL